MGDVTHEPECHIAREVSGDLWFCCCEQLREREADHLAALERVRVEVLRDARSAVIGLRDAYEASTPVLGTVGISVLATYAEVRDELDRLINAATTGDTDD